MSCRRCYGCLLQLAAFVVCLALVFGAGVPMLRLAWAGRYGFAY